MPPVNRKSPSPVRRRPAVAGIRTPGADRNTTILADPVAEPVEPAPRRRAGIRRWRRRDNTASGPAATGPRSRLLPVALAVAALMVLAAVVLTTVSFVHARGPDASAASRSNVALVDAPATQQVAAAATNVLQTAYSYTYTTIDANLDAAVALMTPEMGAKHRASFDTIRKAVTDAKTTTKASVVSDAVRLLSGDRAEVIAFVVVNGDNGGKTLQPSGYRFTASMLRVNDKWLLSDLTES